MLTVQRLNYIAFATLGAAKLFGMIGLFLGCAPSWLGWPHFYRILGGSILAIAFSFIVITILLCMKAMRLQKTQPTDGFETL